MKKTLWIYFVLLLFVALFGMKALFHPGFYTSHDGWHQVARLYHFDKELHDGHIPPRWAGDLLYGSGYPLFFFSYHMPWYMAEPFVLAGVSYFEAIKIVFIIGFVLSGLFMYLWLREMWGNTAGFIGAFLYIWAPYRFSNVFVRGALGEATSFMFLPLIFWSVWRLSKKYDYRFLLVGIASFAGLILSHAMIVDILFVPFALFYGSLLLTLKEKRKFIVRTIILGLLSFGISSYYLIPAIYYQKITAIDSILKGHYQGQFPTLQRVLYSPWGYGFSEPGVDSMSLQLGIAQWLILALTLIVLSISVFYLLKKKKNLKDIFVPLSFFLGSIFSVWMILPFSKDLWKLIENTIIIDYPWRFLSLSVFCISVIGGWFIYMIKPTLLKIIVVICIILIAFYTNKNHMRVNQYTNVPLSLYIASERTTNTYDEYLPKWSDRQYLTKEGRSFIPKESELQLTSVTVASQNTTRKEFLYVASQSGKLSVNLVYFPGWQAYLDGNNTNVDYDKYGLIRLNAPSGNHRVILEFMNTSITNVANIVSLISVLALLAIKIFARRLRFV